MRSNMSQKSTTTRLYTFALIFVFFVLAIALIAVLLIGTTSRYMQDDYCYAAILRGDFWKQQVNAYLHETTFSGNRFSLTLFTGVSELFGSKFIQVLPGVMVIAWLTGLFFFFRQIPYFNERTWLNRLETAIIAAGLVLFTLGMSPNWVQVYFWRAGMFPYLGPLLSGSWLMFLIARAVKAEKVRPVWWIAILIVSFLTGGFSEIGATVEVSSITVGILVILFSKRIPKKTVIPFAAALVGSLIALILVIFSPMNMIRLQTSYGESAGLLTTLVNSIKGSLTFYVATLYRPTLYYLSAFLLFLFLGWGGSLRRPATFITTKQAFTWCCGLLLAAFLITVAAMVPGYFAESSYPSDRAQLVPRFISLLLAGSLGIITGNALAAMRKSKLPSITLLLLGVSAFFMVVMWFIGMKAHFHPPAFPEIRSMVKDNPWTGIITLATSGLILGFLIYKKWITRVIPVLIVLMAIPAGLIAARFFAEYPLMKERADLWDGREAQIIELKNKGTMTIVVPAMNSLSGILELSDYEGFWVNHCAAAYYGVDSISAVEPVLDPIQLSDP